MPLTKSFQDGENDECKVGYRTADFWSSVLFATVTLASRAGLSTGQTGWEWTAPAMGLCNLTNRPGPHSGSSWPSENKSRGPGPRDPQLLPEPPACRRQQASVLPPGGGSRHCRHVPPPALAPTPPTALGAPDLLSLGLLLATKAA